MYHLISGGCGFVGRNLVKRLLSTTDATLLVLDDLSAGTPPLAQWLPNAGTGVPVGQGGVRAYENGRLLFLQADFRQFLRGAEQPGYLQAEWGLPAGATIHDAYHFAAIVGGRAKIDGDPMAVAQDLSIDAEFFHWVVRHRPKRVLYPSSSAAYPVDLQGEAGAVVLKESDINFGGRLGQPDMTYGWSKLTGEYLAQIAARHYGISVACVRPFSGYGEDQDLTYPIPAIAARAARREDPFEVWGSGHQGRDFVHIDDCIDCILLAIEKISDGTAVNIGQGRLTSFREIIALMTGFAGYKPEIKPLLDKPVGVHARYGSPELAAEKLGFRPRISIEAGMRRVYEAAVKRLANQ